MKKLSLPLLLSISLFTISFFTQAYQSLPPAHYPVPQPHYPIPQPHPAPYPVSSCGYNYSSECYTDAGHVCSAFMPNYQDSWFSGCVWQDYFYICLELPLSHPKPPVQKICYLQGTPCTCIFNYNNAYIYEPGVFL